MSWITNSKVFAGSSNKEAILAASKSPINQELMRQVAEYLSDDTIEMLKPQDIDVNVDVDEELPEASSEQSESSLNSAPSPRSSSPTPSAPSDESLTDEMKDLEDAGVPDASDTAVDTDNEAGSNDTGSDDVESSESISVYDYNTLMDTLNNQDDTSGVRRISNNNNEIWIYYSDDINLNNIMDPVIECVLKCCPDADFNRLARSKNAIVFLTNE